ncbi:MULTISPECIES: hemagglutinin repeat-containing protein [Pseudomonas]|uniref:Filamentous hemagglutinin outer membrane protein n=1 Tax=Pseudomonas putida (strain DOT-T1E) TaxID=1196325 RepID=I7C6C5_PSEPT|nr:MULTISPECIES: hemagglutinin repeat-containing protein [Pseudomonas]AFO48666.1 filamentous hemagglutinin outer membrane protein [Pseudomonas putida DOT-T1E]UZM92286.1 hemagglutinin repeat-containing protein [Pseudomonas putida DOT-T1E]WPO29023.1 hemagglutinin repeat-containing protein [Pseudomonas sp. BO3-4]
MQTLSQLPPVRPDTLRWAIFLAVLGPSAALAQTGLEAASGPGGTPVIHNGHGVPVIDIVPPNAKGLSHNQFIDYNVATPGLVLNNATAAGQSQLAGALAANPQFQGQAASTILNEVVSRNASLIEGPQEIFGRPADYILANPNGITLNGGSFINTTRAGFVVGTPQFEEQQLRYLDTLTASGTLQVLEHGQGNAGGALELIAPRVDSKGLLMASETLDITVGRNRIDSRSGEVVEHLPSPSSSIDASLFGAMRAGRIRVVSTAEGAGVRVGASQILGAEGVDISSAGGLHVSGSADRPTELRSERGVLKLTAADDLMLETVDGQAPRIEARAGKKLTLDAKTIEHIKHESDSWNKKFWFVTRETYNSKTTTTHQQQQGSQLLGTDSVLLQSGDDMRMTAAKVDAGSELTVDSGAGLDILAGIDSKRTEQQVRHRKDLWRGDSDSDQLKETAKGSTLSAGHMSIKASDNLNVQGSSLHSRGDLAIQAKQADIGTTTLQEHGTQRDYRGDLVSGTFFGDRKGNDTEGQVVAGSTITSDGELTVRADQVAIKGSTVFGKKDAVLYSENGSLAIEADHGSTTSTQRTSDSKLFGLIGSTHESTDRKQQVLVSDVSSISNLRLASAEEMRIQGAKVEAGKHLQVEAKGDLLIGSAQSVDERETRDQQRGFTASARQTQEAEDGKPESRQYAAGVAYEVVTTTSKQRATSQIASELKGASVGMSSSAHLQVNGSKVQATAGDLDVQAREVTLGATRNDRDVVTSTTESGGGLTVTGGIDRLGSLFEGHHNREVQAERESKVQRSELQASGDLKLRSDALLTEAAHVEAGNTLQVTAKRIDNRAVQDTHEHEQSRDDWSGSLGASIEYRDLTRPIERLVLGEEAARFQQASPEDAMAPPSVGADMTVEHLKRLENQRRGIAQVSELSAAKVEVKADTLADQGTAWRANAGSLKIEAQQHQVSAAENTQETTVQRLAYGGDARLDTSTGEDLNVRAAGKGGSLDKKDIASTAVPGSLYGQQGIQVQLGSDGRYEGARIDGGEGSVVMHSAGSLALPQATDQAEQQSRQLDGNAWAKVGNRPGSTGVDGRGYLDHGQKLSTQSKAQVAQIDAKGEVQLTSTGDLLLEGTRIGNREAKAGDIRVQSGGQLQVKAASNTQQATGANLGGGMELAAKAGQTQGGAIGGHFSHGKQDEHARQAVDAQFASNGTLTLTSSAREDIALHLQGLQASAEQITLDASNGGMLVEASSSQERRDNLDISAGAGFNMAKGALDTRGLHGRLKVELDKRDNLTWNTSDLRAERIDLQSRGDTRIESATLDAKHIGGTIDGDLRIASLKDNVNTLSVKGDVRLSQEKNPQGYVNAAKSVAGPLGGKVEKTAGSALSKADPGFSPTVSLDVSHAQRDNVARQTTLKSSDGIDLQVGGNAHLVGARLQSAKGDVRLDANSVTQETLSGNDYRRDLSLDASNSPVDLGTAIAEIAKSKMAADGENALDLGVLRTSGHSRSEQWASSMQGKKH